MKAVRFHPTIPRYTAGIILSRLSKSVLWSGISCTTYDDIPEPELPTQEWVVVRTRYGGICGSDISAVKLSGSPYFTPYMSFPHTLGHENIGTIARLGKDVRDFNEGDRVVVEPHLWCRPRGFKDLCRYCQRGQVNLCERVTQGILSPGLLTGFCRDTGGSWSPYFLAHQSQLYKVPEEISDENGLMVEPFSVGLHAAICSQAEKYQNILVIGVGAIGLCTIASLILLFPGKKLHVIARYPFQKQAALKLGADRVITSSNDMDIYEEIASITGARILKPILGKQTLLGGYDQVYDCVGSSHSIDNALRLVRSGGQVVLVGVPGVAKNVDWSAIFGQELELKAAYLYNHVEPYAGEKRHAFDLVFDFMQAGKVDVGWMVTHKFKLEQYRQALELQLHRGSNQVIRTVFEFPPP